MKLQTTKTYLLSYPYKGSRYSAELRADSMDDARERVLALRNATLDGELKLAIALPYADRPWFWPLATFTIGFAIIGLIATLRGFHG